MYAVFLKAVKTWNFRNNSIIYNPEVLERKAGYKCYNCEDTVSYRPGACRRTDKHIAPGEDLSIYGNLNKYIYGTIMVGSKVNDGQLVDH